MTTLDTSSLRDLRQAQAQLTERLAHFRRRVRTRLVIEGTAILLAELAGACFLTLLADHTFRLGLPARVGLLLAAVLLLLYESWKRIVVPLRLKIGLIALAESIDRQNPQGRQELAARVASVLELPRLMEGPYASSPAMIDRAVRRCHASLAGVDFDAALDQDRLNKMRLLATVAFVLPVLLALLFPATANLWARRFFLGSNDSWPQNTYLEITDAKDNRIAVPRGEPYVLRAKARDNSTIPSRIQLSIRGVNDDVRITTPMKEFSKNDFRYDFSVIDQPLQLEFEGGDDYVGPITLVPIDRPRITTLLLQSQHTRQSAPETHTFTGGDADFSFLVKTKLLLSFTANVPLSNVRVISQSPAPTQADLHPVDSTHFTIGWTQEGPAKFDLELVAADSTLISLPIPISIGLKADQPPRVAMTYSGVHPRITAQASIPLSIDARDDFGIVAAALDLKDETPDPADPAKLLPHNSALPLFPGPATQPSHPIDAQPLLQLKQTFDVAPLKLPTGALLSVTALATDDCYVGPQTARSHTVTFRIVQPEELFREILQRQQAERIKFRKQMEEAEKIRDSLKTVTLKDLADLARRHRVFQRETQTINGVLSDSLTEMELNGLGSVESHTLMRNSVLTPMKSFQDELVSPQGAAIDAIASSGESQIDEAKAQIAADHENQIVDRMKGILQKMDQWDSFVDVLNQLDGIIKLETQVKVGSEKLQHNETEGLFDK